MTSEKKIQELLGEAWKLRGLGKYEDSKQLLVQAHNLCEPEDYNLLGKVFHIYMQYEYDQSNFGKALAFNEQSLSYYHKADNLERIAHTLRHRADLLKELKDFEQAQTHYIIAIDIFKAKFADQKANIANALRGYASLLEKWNKPEKAISIWKQCRDHYKDVQLSAGVNEAENKIAQLNNGFNKR